jgi:hypothetical protein
MCSRFARIGGAQPVSLKFWLAWRPPEENRDQAGRITRFYAGGWRGASRTAQNLTHFAHIGVTDRRLRASRSGNPHSGVTPAQIRLQFLRCLP